MHWCLGYRSHTRNFGCCHDELRICGSNLCSDEVLISMTSVGITKQEPPTQSEHSSLSWFHVRSLLWPGDMHQELGSCLYCMRGFGNISAAIAGSRQSRNLFSATEQAPAWGPVEMAEVHRQKVWSSGVPEFFSCLISWVRGIHIPRSGLPTTTSFAGLNHLLSLGASTPHAVVDVEQVHEREGAVMKFYVDDENDYKTRTSYSIWALASVVFLFEFAVQRTVQMCKNPVTFPRIRYISLEHPLSAKLRRRLTFGTESRLWLPESMQLMVIPNSSAIHLVWAVRQGKRLPPSSSN